jgi:hypothetical protein
MGELTLGPYCAFRATKSHEIEFWVAWAEALSPLVVGGAGGRAIAFELRRLATLS